MNVSKFREKLAPLASELKNEANKLRAAFNAVHERHVQTAQELNALYHTPAHRSELELFLAEFLDGSIKRQTETFLTQVGGFRDGHIANRADNKKNALDNMLFRSDPNLVHSTLLLLLSLNLKVQLSAIVNEIPWPDAPDPATRDQQIAALEKQAAIISAELTELNEISESAGIKLR